MLQHFNEQHDISIKVKVDWGLNVPKSNRHTTLTIHQPSWYFFLHLCFSKQVKALAVL